MPNLTVPWFVADRDKAQVGTTVTFFVRTANVGHLFVRGTRMALYDGAVAPDNLIGAAYPGLEDFERESTFVWTAVGLGDHTIIAYADPLNETAEMNESDNQATLSIQVTPDPQPGRADIYVSPEDIVPSDIPVRNLANPVYVTVRNVGGATAAIVGVTVLEVETGTQVANYAATIPAGGQDVRQVTWTPGAYGARHLRVTASYLDAEVRTDNNVAEAGFFVRPEGTVVPCPDLPCPPPPPPPEFCLYGFYGDLIIRSGQTVVFSDCLLLMRGNVIVESGGSLQLYDATMTFYVSYDGQRSLIVQGGSQIIFSGSGFGGSWFSRGSKLTSGFIVEAMANFTFASSTAWWVWGDTSSKTAPGGIQVYTSQLAFAGSQVREGRTHGLYLGAGVSVADLAGNSFLDNEGAGVLVGPSASANLTSSTFSGNAFGVLAEASSPRVDGAVMPRNRYGLRVEGPSSAVLVNSHVTNSTIAGAWYEGTASGSPRLTGNPNFAWNRFGAYALLSSLRIDNSTFILEDSGAVFDASPTGVLDRVGATAMNYTVTIANGSAVVVSGSSLGMGYYSSRRVAGVTYQWTAASCTDSSCDFAQDTLPGLCEGIVAERGPALSVRDNTTITVVGCGDQRPLKAYDFGSTTVEWSLLSTSQQSIGVRNTTLRIVNNDVWGKVTVTSSPGARIEDNDLRGQIEVSSSSNVSFLRNSVTSERGLYLLTSANALVTDNTFTGIYYWSPTVRPKYGPGNQTLDAGHIAVYNNATATILRNRFVRGAWGISLDDRDCGNCPNYRNNYAWIEDNSFDYNGFLAIGVDTTSRADIRNNWINRSSGWAIQMESGYPLPSNPGGLGNTVTGNWVNDTNGLATYWGWNGTAWVFTGASCDATTIQLYYEDATKPGFAEVWLNHIARTNSTGIRICRDKAVYVHDNFLDGGGAVANGTYTGPTEAGITLHAPHTGAAPNRIQGNAVEGFGMGLWVKTNTGGWDVSGNGFTGNDNGILVGWGDVPNGYAWAALYDNTFTGNVAGVNVSAANWSPTEGPFNETYVGNATLRRNTIANNTYGVYVRVFIKTYNVTVRPSPYVQLWDHNTITGNAYGVYLKGGYLPNGTLYPAWADITGNNTIASNGYGVWIDGPTVDPTANHFWLWWNDVRGNGEGVHVAGDGSSSWGGSYPWAKCNWWNSVGGPYDPPPDNPDTNDNPDPNAQPVSDYFRYRDPLGTSPRYQWLNNTSDSVGTVCLIG